MYTDQRGLPLSAANEDAVRHFNETVSAYLAFSRATGDHLKQALAADPELVMGHCLRGYFFKLFCHRKLEEKAKECHARAEAAAHATGATSREFAHIDALAAWLRGDFRTTVERWESILLDHPRDVLAIRLGHYLHFYLGDNENMRDSVARVLGEWDETVPNYGNLLGMYAFGLEEAGQYAEAEAAGRRAVAINPADPWAVHAVAHVMEMQGRACEGLEWITSGEGAWSGCNNMRYHVWWHQCLFHLELEQHDEVLALYDQKVRADLTEEYLDICNAGSLLWRFEDAGIDVGARWAELAEKSERRIGEHYLTFVDAHYMMALAGAGQDSAARAMLDSLRALDASERASEAPISDAIGLPLCEAMLAYRQGDYARVVDLLMPLRYDIIKIGGSHAQRDVFVQMLIEAALKAERFKLARALLAERTTLRPQSPASWKLYARALDGLGEADRAAEARAKAEALIAA